MQIVNVEIIRSQPLKAFIDGPKHSAARKAFLIVRISGRNANLAGSHHPVPAISENPPDDLFRSAAVIGIGSVNKIYTFLESVIDQASRLAFACLGPESHSSQARS